MALRVNWFSASELTVHMERDIPHCDYLYVVLLFIPEVRSEAVTNTASSLFGFLLLPSLIPTNLLHFDLILHSFSNPHPSISFSTPPILRSHSRLPYPSISSSTPPSVDLILHSPILRSHSPLSHPSISFSTPLKHTQHRDQAMYKTLLTRMQS